MFSALEAAEIKDKIREKIPKNLNLLITGKTGVGKSHLVNALVGQEVAKEGEELDPCTSEVASYEANIEGVTVTVWDSPGLQDGTTKEDEYIQDMKTKVKDVALMVYCVKMDDTRFQEADKKAIRILTGEFGKEVWNHAVMALTFANTVEDHKKREDKKAYFQKKLNMWEKHLVEYFSSITRVRIPVIPAGIGLEMRLPDRENWLSDVWVGCYKVTKASARLGLYKINKNSGLHLQHLHPSHECHHYWILSLINYINGNNHKLKRPYFCTLCRKVVV